MLRRHRGVQAGRLTMLRWPFFKRRLSPIEKAERASTLAVPTQHVARVREQKARVLRERLMGVVPTEARERIAAKLQEAEAAR